MKPRREMRVLLVDDEPVWLLALTEELKNEAGTVRVLLAENGVRALEVLESETVDLIITDYKMPVMDGLELVSCLRKAHPDIDVIVVSSFLYPELKQSLAALGVKRIIDKQAHRLDGIAHAIVYRLKQTKKEEIWRLQ
jgi:two-component system, response regulator YesN